MRSWSKGLKEGNRPVGDGDVLTLKHIKYTPKTNTVDVDRAMKSTLNSYLLDNQHKMSSGAENIFFTNLESDVDWYPMWGGIKSQQDVANRDKTGLYQPSARVYSDDLYIIEPYGPPTVQLDSVPYAKPAAMLGNHSVYGQEIIVAEDVAEDDYILYQLYFGQDNTGRLAYEQKITGNVLTDGDTLDWWFTHPAEGHVGTPIYTTVLLIKGGEDITKETRPLLVRPSSANPLNHYSKIYLRIFEDKDIAFKSDIGGRHSVYITDVTTRDGEAIDLTRLPQPDEEQVIEINTNSLQLTIDVEWDRTDKFQGVVTINDVEVVPTYSFDGTYKGSVDIEVEAEDGSITVARGEAVDSIPLVRLQIPQILTATLSDIYPGTQTELKAGDVVQISVTTDLPVSRLDYISGLAVGTNVTFPKSSEFTVDLTVTTTTTITQLIAQEITVTDIATSEASITTNSMSHNNLYPVITFGLVTYPVGQQALKGSEQATVVNQVLNADSIDYVGTEVSIPNPTILGDKVVTRTSGQYNITTNNFTINATRTANDASSSSGTVVWIADQVPVVSIDTPSHLRSGGNDGTLVQDHRVTITANQRVLPPVTLDASIGSWQGSWVNMITSLIRDLRIHDNDVKGTGVFSNLSVFNLAGIEINIASGLTYECQGFVSRVVNITPFGWQATINVELTNSDNLIADWSFKEGIMYTTSTNRPQVDKYNLKPNGSIKLLDKSATDSSSTITQFTIEET